MNTPSGRKPSIDLNADVGEECGDDLALLDIVTSANIACGAHAGSPMVMARTVDAALGRGVAIGAHVSYPDRANFGRRTMSIDAEQLKAELRAQIGALAALAGTNLRYVKAHGALYNTMADDPDVATTVVEAVVAAQESLRLELGLLMLPSCVGATIASRCGLVVFAEGFADRQYTDDVRLVPRDQPGAVLHDVEAIAARAPRLVNEQDLDSLCVHGDTPGAVAAAAAARRALVNAGYEVAPFAGRFHAAG